MKHIHQIFSRTALASLALSVAVCTISCSKDNETVDLTAIVADRPSSGDAKVFINGSYACWHNGDVVNINGTAYTIDVSSQSSNTAVIYGVDEDESYTAVYPYSSTGQTCSSGSTAVVTPIAATQLYVEASTASSDGTSQQRIQAPLVAYSTGSQLNFHTPTALLKVVVSNSYTTSHSLKLYSIEVTADKACLSGSASVTAAADTAIYNSLTDNESHSATLQFHEANASATAVSLAKNDSKAFYIAIAPVSTASTISVCVRAEDADGKKYTFHSSSASEMTIGQGKMGTVTIGMSASTATEAAWFWGTGSEDCPYLIENESDLNKLSELVADGSYNDNSKHFLQTDVITVSYADWGTSTHPAVGTNANAFVANYDGGGHTVTLGVTTVESGYPVGVFGVVRGGASISNLTVAGSIDLGDSYGDVDAGGVAGKATGKVTFSSCTNQATVTSTYTTAADYGVGGICGAVDATDSTVTFTSCTNSAQVKAYGLKNGGIVGLCTAGTLNLTTCTNSGAIVSYDGSSTYYDHCGGIIGMVSSSNGTVTLTSCVNKGDVTGNGSIGGFIGQINRACEITGTSSNNGDVTGNGGSVAGVIGSVQGNATITIHGTRTTNNNPIVGGYNVAGIVGFTNGAITLENCWNDGDILATTYSDGDYGVAGIVARINASSYNMTINHCKNLKKIESTANGSRFYIGGVVGYSYTKNNYSRITNSYNTGLLKGNERRIGGIAAEVHNLIMANCYNTGNMEGTINGSTYGVCGGVVGYCNGSSTVYTHNKPECTYCYIDNCYNSGTRTGITAASYRSRDVAIKQSFVYCANCYGITNYLLQSYANATSSTESKLYQLQKFESDGSFSTSVKLTDYKHHENSYGSTTCSTLISALNGWRTYEDNASYGPWDEWFDSDGDGIPTFDW